MTAKATNTFKTGMFIVVALAFFVFSIFFLGSEREIFSSQREFYSVYKDVKGLAEGAPVRLGGITIGKVSSISFATDTSDSEKSGDILVTLSISEKHLDKIRVDSRVSLETQGLLGDKFINISVGKDPTVVPPGALLPVTTESDITELMTKAAKFADNTLQISEDLRSLTIELRGDKALGESIREAHELLKNVNEITKEVKNGNGLLHAMIYDKEGGKAVKSFGELSENLNKASQEITSIVSDIRNGNGVLHDLVYNKTADNQGLSDVIKRLNETSENLKVASQALRNGNGTLGALLVDSKLYDNLVEVTNGAKRSFILRQAIRSSLNASKK